MPSRPLFALVFLSSLSAALAAPGPPYIRQGGVVNAASRLASPLPGSPLAPGSLFSIRGARLGPVQGVRGGAAATAGVLVEIAAGASREAVTVFYADESRILALMPKSIQSGEAHLVVTYAAQSSAPYQVRIKTGTFGIFARQPEIFTELPAELQEPPLIVSGRGKTIMLSGTGLGSPPPSDLEVRVGGKKVDRVSLPSPKGGAFPGVDSLAFEVPVSAPLGCQVPILVRTAGTWSNTITVALEEAGRSCAERTTWISKVLAAPGASGAILLLRFLFYLDLGNGKELAGQWDSALADFSRTLHSPAGQRFSLPPAGVCVSYHGIVELGGFLNPPLPGEERRSAPEGVTSAASLRNPFHLPIAGYLDAGPYLTIKGRRGERRIARDPQLPESYLSHIGGAAPVPGRTAMPMFLDPGKFHITSPGGKDVGRFTASVSMPAPIEWTNRLEVREVTRSLGTTVKWRQRDATRVTAIIAGAVDRVSGAGGLVLCAAPAGRESFTIPPEALANLPETDASEDLGRPVTGIVLASFPGRPQPGFRAAGLDSGSAIAGFVTGQPVSYR